MDIPGEWPETARGDHAARRGRTARRSAEREDGGLSIGHVAAVLWPPCLSAECENSVG